MSRQIFRSDLLIGSRPGIPAWLVLKPGIVRALLRLGLVNVSTGYVRIGGWFFRLCIVIVPTIPRLCLGPCCVTLPVHLRGQAGTFVPKFAVLICGLKRPTHDAPLEGWGKCLFFKELGENGG